MLFYHPRAYHDTCKNTNKAWERTKLEYETSNHPYKPIKRGFQVRTESAREQQPTYFNFWVAEGMADHQRIHPMDVGTLSPSAPQASCSFSQSEKHDATDRRPPLQGTIPVIHSEPAYQKSCCCFKCLCCTALTIFILIILIGAIAGALYLIFDPKIPKYSVDHLSISAFDVDKNMVRTSFNVTVTARNPNKKIGIYYEEGSYVSVLYNDSSLCNGSFPEFYQGHRNTTVLNVIMIGKTQLGTELLSKLQQQQQAGLIPLLFRGNVPVRVKFGGLKLWKVTFRVKCNLVVNSLSASNQIIIKSSSC